MEDRPTSEIATGETELGRRLGLLEDERAIERLKYAYTSAVDNGYELDRICSLFVPEGRWVADGFGEYRGREAIRGFFADLSRSIAYAHHYASAPHIEVDADGTEARGEWKLLCLSGQRHRDDPSLHLPIVELGRYRDRLVKRDGVWLFEELRAEVTLAKRVVDLLERPTV